MPRVPRLPMRIEYDVISIGTLAANPLWHERLAVRTGHATTTLIRTDEARIIVDPSLPPPAMLARLGERCDVKPDDISHVFLTSYDPDHGRGISAFPDAAWLMHEPEQQHAMAQLHVTREDAREADDDELANLVAERLALLERFRAAADSIVRGVDLFPLPGVTPGTCGLLLPLPGLTVLIAGDAVATAGHLEQGQVLPQCLDVEQAQESFREAIEIADVIIPGRDNIVTNPLRRIR